MSSAVVRLVARSPDGPSRTVPFQQFETSLTACGECTVSQDLLAAADARATRVTAAPSCVVTVRPDVATLLPSAPLVVDCWIGVCDEGDRRVVRLAGRLCEDQVPELLLACSTPPQVTLDLSDLVSTDDAGLDALNRIRARGGTLTGAPRYIQLKLDSSARRHTRHAHGDVVDQNQRKE